jgi:BA14K-like protein
MVRLTSAIISTALAAVTAVASVIPLEAAPIFVPNGASTAQGDVLDVQYRRLPPRGHINRSFDRQQARADFYRNGGRYYYRGHRGYRYYRPGYREYNGWWFPAAAFLTGALITGAINSAPRYGGNAHVQWCYDHYRSYRASDNTFQPNNGPRRQCNSPYD